MALRTVSFQSLFRGGFCLQRSNVEALGACYTMQYRFVQSQRDNKKDSRVVRPWHVWIEKFENKFQRKYPKVYKVYALFKQGTKDFVADGKRFYRVSMRIRGGEPLHKFSRTDLELLLQMPRDGVRVLCIFLIIQIPIVAELYFPLAYFFPRHLLCRHYWTPEQRQKFASLDVKRRMALYDSVLGHLQQTCEKMKEGDKKALSDIVKKLTSRAVPAVNDVISVKSAFSHPALSIQAMPWSNLINLSRSVNLSIWRKRIQHSSHILLAADRALSRESVDLLNDTELREVCAIRGLNPAGLSKSEMTNYLKSWLDISLKLKENDVSLLLHTPTLLARNHPNNTKLVKS